MSLLWFHIQDLQIVTVLCRVLKIQDKEVDQQQPSVSGQQAKRRKRDLSLEDAIIKDLIEELVAESRESEPG